MKPGDPEFDESEFYGHDFEKDGILSFWVGLSGPDDDGREVDVLQDLCGVGYYNLDDQESNCEEFALLPLGELIAPMSYSNSYMTEVLAAAKSLGIDEARWVVVQFNFEYDPTKVKGTIHADPVFLGAFPYSAQD